MNSNTPSFNPNSEADRSDLAQSPDRKGVLSALTGSKSSPTSEFGFIPNLQILANAGSGKTHHLISRIVRLLAMGVQPEKIIALTFTRKAAGEFLEKLLHRLAAAASDEREAARLSRDTRIFLSSGGYQELLRKVVDELGRLQLTTLDAFFNRVVTAFPQELGLTGSPSLLDPSAEELAGQKALRKALAKLRPGEQRLLLQSLLERDDETAPVSASEEIGDFRRQLYSEYLDHPAQEEWGNPERIWGASSTPWTPITPSTQEAARNEILREAESPDFPSRAKSSWLTLLALQRGTKLNAILEQILKDLPSWKTGTGSFTYYKKTFTLSGSAQQAAAALLEHYLYESTEYRLKEAHAVHHLLDLYHREYDAEVRGRGMLSFSDITALLQPGEKFEGMTRGEGEGDSTLPRLRLDERLDARFDHWLLDEFQDTSRSQYQALANILDEVISEAARRGERSFFCVGDIKQAIYGWRKGESRLFDEIHDHYRLGMRREALSDSWRSSTEVLEALNRVFGALDTTAPGIPAEARTRWSRAWSDHKRAPGAAVNLPGFVSWQTTSGDTEQSCQEEIEQLTLNLLSRVQPKLQEGMTIALLVRTGKESAEWLEILRQAGIPALSESNPPVGRDNPIAAALHSLLSLTAHPGDRFALGHLSMEPLRAIFFPGNNPQAGLSELIEAQEELLTGGGFAALTEDFLKRLKPLLCDDFSRDRAAALLRAAQKADSSGVTHIDDLLLFLEEYEEPGRAAPHAVQVMTIHKAKGLEYDMVLLPLKGRNSLDFVKNTRIDLWHSAEGENDRPFLLKLPDKAIRSAPGNEPLLAVESLKRAELAFESLCVWYVAMSRAKQGLYLFSSPPDPKGEKKAVEDCPSFPLLLRWTLSERTSWGDPEWFTHFQPRIPAPDPDPLPETIPVPPRASALEKQTPSDEGHAALPGSQAFSERNATALGTAIHAFFESIEWLEDIPWKAPEKASAEAVELMEQCLQSPELRELLTKPPGASQVWREQRFDLLQEECWVSGCFDRVVIFRDETGAVTKADLIDFKTDQGSRGELIASYRPQLLNYRSALSQLLHLPGEKIRMILIQVRSEDPVVVVS